MRRLERSRLSLTAWGVIGITLITLGILIAFYGTGPLGGKPFELRAVLRSESQIKPRSPVRIAGIEVGKVTSVEPADEGADAVVATMALEDDALPVFEDAGLAIHSRLVFEGNFYVALDPGTPGADEMESGDTIGVDRTSGPVQLDRVLADLPKSTRLDLRTVVQGFGGTLSDTEDGESTSEALNQSLENAPEALEGVAKVSEGLQGTEPQELSQLIEGSRGFMGALASQEAELTSLITNFNRTMQATASRQDELGRSVALLHPFLEHTESGLTELERALPDTTLLAQELIPGVRELPPTIDALTPWVGETTALLGPQELGGLLRSTKPAVRNGASFVKQAIPILKGLGRIERCFTQIFLPNGDVVVNDPPLPSGPTLNEEFFQAFVGIVSASQNFDGNGRYIRAQTAGGAYPVATGELPRQGAERGNAVLPPIGTRPAFPGKLPPPVEFGVDCASNQRPDINSASTGGTP